MTSIKRLTDIFHSLSAIETGAATRFVVVFPVPDAQGSKADTSPIGSISLIFTFLFSTLSMLNISLVWIQIADNAEKMRRTTTINITRYRNFLIAYYVLFFGVIVFAISFQNLIVAAAVSLPGIVFVIISYLLGFFKMRKMLVAYLTSSGPGSNGIGGSLSEVAGKETIRKFRESLQAIQWAALGVSGSSFLYIIFLGAWVLLGGFKEEPNSEANAVMLANAWIFVACGNATVMWYIDGVIQRKVKQLKGSSADKAVIVHDITMSENPSKTHYKEESRGKTSANDQSVSMSPTVGSPKLPEL
jgi:hypothetical protein